MVRSIVNSAIVGQGDVANVDLIGPTTSRRFLVTLPKMVVPLIRKYFLGAVLTIDLPLYAGEVIYEFLDHHLDSFELVPILVRWRHLSIIIYKD